MLSSLKFKDILSMHVRGMAKIPERTLRKQKLKAQRKAQGSSNIPPLKSTLRQLYLKTHPDLFAQFPDLQKVNEKSYQELMGVLDSIQKPNKQGSFPAAKKVQLEFHVRPTSSSTDFIKAYLNLKTTGSNCHTVVQESLGDFFLQCGLPPAFTWEAEAWGVLDFEGAKKQQRDQAEEKRKVQNREKNTEEVVEVEKAPAYAGQPRDNISQNSLENVLEKNDELFQVLAVLPHLPDEEPYTTTKKHYIDGTGLDEWKSNGYAIKEAVHMLWKGERDLKKMILGLDTETSLIVHRILMHTLMVDKDIRNANEKTEQG